MENKKAVEIVRRAFDSLEEEYGSKEEDAYANGNPEEAEELSKEWTEEVVPVLRLVENLVRNAKYYSLYCLQNNDYMATGRNSRSKDEIKKDLISFLAGPSFDGLNEQEAKDLEQYSADQIAGMFEFEIHETDEPIPEIY